MDTVKRGDIFEKRSFQIITTALNERRLGVYSEYCRVYQKRPYYSRLRENNIVFDLSIEVWPPGADRCHFLYLIECKDYEGTIPVSDIEEFIAKIQQVAGINVKGIFITTGDVQESGLKLLRNLNFMFIKVSGDQADIVLHNKGKNKAIQEDFPVVNILDDIQRLSAIRNLFEHPQDEDIVWDKVIGNFLRSELNNKINWEEPGERARGLEYLSKKLLANLTEDIVNEFDHSILKFGKPFPMTRFMTYLTEKYDLKFVIDKPFKKSKAHLNGYYDRKNKVIHINPVVCVNQFAFVCAHEIGHFFLHEKLQISQSRYEDQPDSKYDSKARKHIFENEKHWIEWQANYFAGCLIMPYPSLLWQLIKWQESIGLSKRGFIWLDNQPCNILDFKKSMTILGFIFEVSRSIIEIRMADLGMIKYQKKRDYSSNTLFDKVSVPKSVAEILRSPKFTLNVEDDNASSD
jgi:Zn-dependent peptidase ImmA (M78 family)